MRRYSFTVRNVECRSIFPILSRDNNPDYSVRINLDESFAQFLTNTLHHSKHENFFIWNFFA